MRARPYLSGCLSGAAVRACCRLLGMIGLIAAVFLLGSVQRARADFVMYVANASSNNLATVTSSGVATLFASGFNRPTGMIRDANGNLYIANSGDNTISLVSPSGTVSTFASGFNIPVGLAFDTNGNLYVANGGNGTISRVTPDGTTSVFANGFDSVPVINAIASNITQGLAFDDQGNLFVTNHISGTVSKVTPAGSVSTFASGFNSPSNLIIDGSNNLYVINEGNDTVSTVTPSGFVSTYYKGISVESACLAFDQNGNLYIDEFGVSDVIKINPNGVRSTFASGSLVSSTGMLIISDPAAPAIITQPRDQTVLPATTVAFTAAISGAPGSNTFKWQRLPMGSSNWVDLSNAGPYSGTTSPTLSITNSSLDMSGDLFRLQIANASGNAVSNPAGLHVNPALIIIQPQTDNFVSSQHAAGFSVDATGAAGASLSYQWKISTDQGATWTNLGNGANVDGADSAVLNLTGMTPAMSGYEYECTITNSFGSVSTNSAALTLQAFLLYVANLGNNTVSVITPGEQISTYASGFNAPSGLAFDSKGNLFVSNSGNGTVSMVTPAGVASTYASGLGEPTGLAFDHDGNLYVGTSGNNFAPIYKVTPAGVISTFASGFNFVGELIFDAGGNLYVAETNTTTISKVTPEGVVSTFANGLSFPYGMAMDGSQNLYVADGYDGPVMAITPPGAVSTFSTVVKTIPSNISSFDGVAFAPSGNLYVSTPNEISVLSPAGVLSTFANGLSQPRSLIVVSPPAAPSIIRQPPGQIVPAGFNATFSLPTTGMPGVNAFQWQRMPVGSSTWTNLTDNAIYTGSTSPILTVINATFAMSGEQFQCIASNPHGSVISVPATLTVQASTFSSQPQDQLVVSSQSATFGVGAIGTGNLSYLWQVSTDHGTTWIALSNNATYSGVTTAVLVLTKSSASMAGYEYECVVTNNFGSATSNPATLSIAPFFIYTANVNGGLLKISPTGVASTFANGIITLGSFSHNTSDAGLAFDGNGDLFVASYRTPAGNRTVAEVSSQGTISTAASGFNEPNALAFDASGNLYVVNYGNGTISRMTPAGNVSVFATGFTNPAGLAFDGNGNLFVANSGNGTVSKVTPAGVVSTFSSGFSNPFGLAFDGNGNLYVADFNVFKIYKVTPTGTVSTFVRVTLPSGLAFDASGNLYVTSGIITKITPDGITSTFSNSQIGGPFLAIISTPTSPTITHQPKTQTALTGNGATFSLSNSGAPGSCTYQWQRLPAGSSNWITLSDDSTYSGSGTASLAVSTANLAMSGDQFQCIVTNAQGSTPTTAAQLTVTPVPTPPATPVASYAAWQSLWFTPAQIQNSMISAALATPAADGVPNLIKYAFNLNPFSPPGSNVNPALPLPTISNGNLSLTFNATQSDLTYTVQVSTDLVNWTTQGVSVQSNGTLVTANYPLPPSGPVFLRIAITVNNP